MPLRRTHHSLPRFVQNNEDHIELNGFSDASIKAYFAVIYIRVVRADGTVSVSLIAGKTTALTAQESCSLSPIEALTQRVSSWINGKMITFEKIQAARMICLQEANISELLAWRIANY